MAPNTEPADGLTAVDVTVTGTNFEYPLTVHFGSAAQQTVASSGPNATCTMVVVKGYVPLAEMFGYVNDLRSMTSGRANYSMEFSHYDPVPKGIAETIIAKATR